MTKTGETVQFYYNDEGLRVRKVSTTGGTTEYTLHGKQIVHMTNGSNELHFYYGSDGKPAFVQLGTAWYAYVYNLQGDVVALTNSSGAVVVEYRYDAWGKPLATTGTLASTLGKLNPFRYRGYVYDEETGLYYLRSRYYRAEWCRFVNEDAVLHGNSFCYCNNGPLFEEDQSGMYSTVNKNDVRIRRGPGTDYNILGYVQSGMAVEIKYEVTGKEYNGSNQWYYVEIVQNSNDKRVKNAPYSGYIHSSFIDNEEITITNKESPELKDFLGPILSPNVKFKDTGVEVYNLQLFLLGSRSSYITSMKDCDGVFGSVTKKALIEWQANNMDFIDHIDPADGILGPKTREAMYCYSGWSDLYYLRNHGVPLD